MTGGNIKLLPEIELLTEKLLADPKSRIFAQLADAYRKSDLIDEAIDTAKKGLEHHPKYAIAHLILGRCYLVKGMYALAREEFELAIKNDPQNLVGYKLLGETFEKQKMYPEALKYYQMVLDIEPADSELSEKVANLKNLQPPEPETVSQPAEKIKPEEATPAKSAATAELPVTETSDKENIIPLPEALMQEPVLKSAEDMTAVPTKVDVEEIPLPPVLAEEPSEEIVAATEMGRAADVQQLATSPADGAVISPDGTTTENKPPEQISLKSGNPILEAEAQGPTSTLAEIYVQQGFVEKAIDIYKELIASQPENELYKSRIDELLSIAYPEEKQYIAEPVVPVEETDKKTTAQNEPPKPEPAKETILATPLDVNRPEDAFSQMFAEMEKAAAPEPVNRNEPAKEPVEIKEQPVAVVFDNGTGMLGGSIVKTDPEPALIDFGALFNDYNQPPAEKEKPAENTQTPAIAPEDKNGDLPLSDNSEGDDTVSSFQSWLAKIQK